MADALSATSATFSVTQIGAEGGPVLLTPGNRIAATQTSAVLGTISHNLHWGGGTQQLTIPSGTLSLAIRFDGWDTVYPSRLLFTVTSLAATVPSFSSVALGGGMTGDNVFSAREEDSNGYIDTATGEINANVYGKFFNGVFVSAPAIVQVKVLGTYNALTRTATISFPAGSVRAIAQSPGDTPDF